MDATTEAFRKHLVNSRRMCMLHAVVFFVLATTGFGTIFESDVTHGPAYIPLWGACCGLGGGNLVNWFHLRKTLRNLDC